MSNSKNVLKCFWGRKVTAAAMLVSTLCAGAYGQANADIFRTMLNVPALNVSMARAGMNSLQKRMGELRYMGNETKKHGVWVRGYYKDATVKEFNNVDMDLWGVEAGQDWLFFPYNPTKLYVGGMVGFHDAPSIRSHKIGYSQSKGDGYAPSVGLYATLMDDRLWFVDVTVRDFFTRTDMEAYANGVSVMKYVPKRNVLAWSLEAGKTVERRVNARSWWHITPKLGLTNMYAFSSSAPVTHGVGDLRYDTTRYLSGKVAMQFEYTHLRPNGLLIAPLFEVGYSYEFAGDSTMSYGGVSEKVSAKGGTFEVDLGLNMQLNSRLYWYALGSYENGSKFRALGAHAGIRFMFGNQPAQPKTYADSQSSAYTEKMIPQEEVTYYIPMQQAQPRPEVTTHYVHPKGSAPVLGTTGQKPVMLDNEVYEPAAPDQVNLLKEEDATLQTVPGVRYGQKPNRTTH